MFNFDQQSQPVTIVINGNTYFGFKSATVQNSLDTVSGTFSFVATNSIGQDFPLKLGDSCQILINNTAVITGFIEKIDIKYGVDEHIINISGRDATCDIIDSKLGGNITFVPPIGLDEVAKKVIEYLNIDNISVEWDTDETIDPFISGELMSAEIGETGFNFLEKYAQKRQVLLTTDGLGNLVLSRSSSNFFNSVISCGVTSSGSVLNASLSMDNTQRFNQYIVHTQENSAAKGSMIISSPYKIPSVSNQVVHQTAKQIDQEIRDTRIYNFKSSSPEISQKALQDRVIWEMNYRKSNSYMYTVTMQGFTAPQDGRIWRTNYLVNVIDDYYNIMSELLIKSVSFDYSMEGGSRTTLELVNKDVYTLKLPKIEKIKKQKEGKSKIIESPNFKI